MKKILLKTSLCISALPLLLCCAAGSMPGWPSVARSESRHNALPQGSSPLKQGSLADPQGSSTLKQGPLAGPQDGSVGVAMMHNLSKEGICQIYLHITDAKYQEGKMATQIGFLNPGQSKNMGNGARLRYDEDPTREYKIVGHSCLTGRVAAIAATPTFPKNRKVDVVFYDEEKPTVEASSGATVLYASTRTPNPFSTIVELVHELKEDVCRIDMWKIKGDDVGALNSITFGQESGPYSGFDKMQPGQSIFIHLADGPGKYRVHGVNCSIDAWVFRGILEFSEASQLVFLTPKSKPKAEARAGFKQELVDVAKTQPCPSVQMTTSQSAAYCKEFVSSVMRKKCEDETRKRVNFGKKAPFCG